MGMTRDTPSRQPEPEPNFESLYQRFRLPLYRVIRGIVLDGGAAEDLTRRAFERAYVTRRPEQSVDFPPWLYGVGVALALDHLSSRWRRLRGLHSRLPLLSPRRPEVVERSAEHVLSRLSPRQRALVVLTLYARLSDAEVGRALRLSASEVRLEVNEAARLMQAALSETDHPGVRKRHNP
jgi:RNA polymerase sigma factor (sigma-70 family)